MRLPVILLLSSLSLSVLAEDAPKLPAAPPPPPLAPASAVPDTAPAAPADHAADEQGVTITTQGGQKVEEYRVAGRLFMIKVTPKNGPAYYLVDDRGDGKFVRQESLDTGFRPPQWVIHRF